MQEADGTFITWSTHTYSISTDFDLDFKSQGRQTSQSRVLLICICICICICTLLNSTSIFKRGSKRHKFQLRAMLTSVFSRPAHLLHPFDFARFLNLDPTCAHVLGPENFSSSSAQLSSAASDCTTNAPLRRKARASRYYFIFFLCCLARHAHEITHILYPYTLIYGLRSY